MCIHSNTRTLNLTCAVNGTTPSILHTCIFREKKKKTVYIIQRMSCNVHVHITVQPYTLNAYVGDKVPMPEHTVYTSYHHTRQNASVVKVYQNQRWIFNAISTSISLYINRMCWWHVFLCVGELLILYISSMYAHNLKNKFPKLNDEECRNKGEGKRDSQKQNHLVALEFDLDDFHSRIRWCWCPFSIFNVCVCCCLFVIEPLPYSPPCRDHHWFYDGLNRVLSV